MKAADFNENLCCSLCKSYLIDAVTLTECLHFFCRSCLLAHLCHESRCPKCASDLGTELSEAFVRDETLQRLVYKMVPDVYWEELRRRGDFYKRRTISNEEKAILFEKNLLQLSSELCAPSEMVSLCIEYVSPGPSDADDVTTMVEGDDVKPTTLAEADRVEKQEKLVTSFKRYFRCVAATTVRALRKLMEAKLEVSDTYRLIFVDPECNSTLDDSCTLQDVAYMFSWRRESPMSILFTLQRHLEEEKPPVLDMELMPELVAEEPLPQTSTASSSALETPVQLPALTVSLNTSMMEGGSNHQPIITTEVQPPPRKKRKPSSPTKKQQPASPAPPIQRMIGVSPLAKGPPPLMRQEKLESTGGAQGKKTTPPSAVAQNGSPSASSSRKAAAGDKPLGGASSKANVDGPTAPKQPKLASTSSFDAKMRKIISTSTASSSSKSASDSPSSSCSNCNSNSITNPPQSMASDANSNSSSSNSSSGKPHSSTVSTSKSSNTTTSQTTTTTNSTTNSTSNTSSDSQQSTTQYNASGTPSCGQSNAVAHSTSSCNSSSSFSIVSGSGSSSGPNNQPVHPRPIQPRPVVEAKTNYEALVKSYTLNGVNKFAAFALDGKQAKSFAAHAMHVQSSIFLDPKLASQPIKQVLSGRGMPLMPEAAPYLRPPSAQIASFMQHFHMQSFQGGLGPTSSPIMHSNGSAPPSAPPTPSHLAVSQSPPTQISQLKLPTVSTGSADAGKLLGKTSPVPKIQQKIGASLPIPTAHITPFMSQS